MAGALWVCTAARWPSGFTSVNGAVQAQAMWHLEAVEGEAGVAGKVTSDDGLQIVTGHRQTALPQSAGDLIGSDAAIPILVHVGCNAAAESAAFIDSRDG